MPSHSKRQHEFFSAVAHNPKFAKQAKVPQSVGREFIQADKGRKFAEGGDMKESKKMMGKHEKAEMKGAKKYASGGFTRSADGVAKKGKTKATQIKMAKGGKC